MHERIFEPFVQGKRTQQGLPVMGGYELGARIRTQAPNCRLIALTGYGQGEDRSRSAAAGFYAHLVKPVEIAPLLAAISG